MKLIDGLLFLAFCLALSSCASSPVSGSYDIAGQAIPACTWADQDNYFGLINGITSPSEIAQIHTNFEIDFECDLDGEPQS